MGMDDSQQSPSASDLCLINFHLSIVYSIRFLDRIDDPLFDRTDEDLTFKKNRVSNQQVPMSTAYLSDVFFLDIIQELLAEHGPVSGLPMALIEGIL